MRRVRLPRVQSLFKHRLNDATHMVLSGYWSYLHLSNVRKPEGPINFWKNVFEREIVKDERPVQGLVSHWQVWEPISAAEMKEAAEVICDSAARMDRVNAGDIVTKDFSVVVQLFNVMLLLETPTQELSKARATPITKCQNPTETSHYRPISMNSVVLRIFHKIMAQRMTKCLKRETVHVAFQRKDRCMEAAEALHACLREAHEKCKNLAAAFVDIYESFGTISHNSIRKGPSRRVSPRILNYSRRFYDESTV